MTLHDLRVLPADMELFARATGDVNPLHVSAEYARRTPFGEPVVYGVLAALAACGHLRERPGSAVESIALEFLGPLAVGTSYRVEIEDEESTARAVWHYNHADWYVALVLKLAGQYAARDAG